MSYQTELFNYKTEREDIVQLSARVPVWKCDACGDQYTDSNAEEIRHHTVCEYLQRLTPVAVKALRERIGYSQSQWADLTGFGIASVKRWETGALIQGLAQDRYMRLLRDQRNIAALRDMAAGVKSGTKRHRKFCTELSADVIAQAPLFQLRLVGAAAA